MRYMAANETVCDDFSHIYTRTRRLTFPSPDKCVLYNEENLCLYLIDYRKKIVLTVFENLY